MIIPTIDEYIGDFWEEHGHLKGLALILAKRYIKQFIDVAEVDYNMKIWSDCGGGNSESGDYFIQSVGNGHFLLYYRHSIIHTSPCKEELMEFALEDFVDRLRHP